MGLGRGRWAPRENPVAQAESWETPSVATAPTPANGAICMPGYPPVKGQWCRELPPETGRLHPLFAESYDIDLAIHAEPRRISESRTPFVLFRPRHGRVVQK